MARDDRVKDLMAAFQKTTYFKWMAGQRIPVIDGYGVEDVREVEMDFWPRLGGRAAFINLYGMEGVTGMYVGEIPAGGALTPEKHFYEEVICILSGQGATEVWQEAGRKQMFEWGPWSLFALPLNSWHRLVNGGRQPVKFLAVTNAPLIMDVFHNEDFVFNCPYVFSDRYSGADGFFNVGQKRYESGMQHIWETNFIMDIQSADFGPEGGERGGSAHHPIRAVWQWIDRPPSAMAGGTVSQSSLSRRGCDSVGITVVGVCPTLVERGGSTALPKRPW